MKKLSLGLAIWLAFFAVVRSARADILSEPPMRVAEDEEYEADTGGEFPPPPAMDGDIRDDETQQQQVDQPPPVED